MEGREPLPPQYCVTIWKHSQMSVLVLCHKPAKYPGERGRDGGWRVVGWRVEGWRVEGGGWRVEGWRVEGGGWRVEGRW